MDAGFLRRRDLDSACDLEPVLDGVV